MLYRIFKIGAFLAIKIYCKKTAANFDSSSYFANPKIIASNHPNSFFDAILIAVHYPKPIYFLARGDAFKKPLVAKFLNALHLIPIYRLSEGKNNLSKNEDTFKKCIELLHNNQTILIFSEGLCINEWNLRSLKKGTARLALMAIQDNVKNLQIQPTNLNYSNFTKNPKEVELNFNESFQLEIHSNEKESEFYRNFNLQLEKGILDKMIVQNESKNITIFKESKNNLNKTVLAIPAALGFILNFWIYSFFKKLAIKKTKNSVFYDSVLFGLLFMCYPIIVLLISVSIGFLSKFYIGIIAFFMFPISAFCYKEFKS